MICVLFFCGSETGQEQSSALERPGCAGGVAGRRGRAACRAALHFIHRASVSGRLNSACSTSRKEIAKGWCQSCNFPPPCQTPKGLGKAPEWWFQGKQSRDSSDSSRNPHCNPLGYT